MNEQMTLRDLRKIVPDVSGKRIPGKNNLKVESEVVAEYQSTDFALTVFASGYVLAEHLGRWTVFPVHDCGAYEYEVAEDDPFIGKRQTAFDEEYFLDLPWTIRLTLTAEDRLEQNAEIREGKLIAKHPDYIRDFGWLQGFTPSYEHELMRKLEWEEVMESLTERQRKVMELWLDGYTQEEIGRILGIDRSTVATHITCARKNIAKALKKNNR